MSWITTIIHMKQLQNNVTQRRDLRMKWNFRCDHLVPRDKRAEGLGWHTKHSLFRPAQRVSPEVLSVYSLLNSGTTAVPFTVTFDRQRRTSAERWCCWRWSPGWLTDCRWLRRCRRTSRLQTQHLLPDRLYVCYSQCRLLWRWSKLLKCCSDRSLSTSDMEVRSDMEALARNTTRLVDLMINKGVLQ